MAERLQLKMSLANASASNSDYVRITIFQDREARGGTASSSDVYTVSTFGVAQVLSSINFDNRKRFKILHDEIISVYPTVSTASANTSWNSPERLVSLDIPMRGRLHYYSAASAGTPADCDSGTILMIVSGVVGANPSVYSFDSRFIFRDV
jgi:hypothetical protein